MKKYAMIVLGIVMMLSATPAMAKSAAPGAPATVDLGLIEMPRGEFEQLAAMIGETVAAGGPAKPSFAVMEAVGPVEMTAAEADALRRMVAGSYHAAPGMPASDRANEEIQLGLISMPQEEFEALSALVQGHRFDWAAVLAGAADGGAQPAGK